MNNNIQFRLILVSGLIISFFLLTINITAFARKGDPGGINLTNIEWKIEGDAVIITYDLNAPKENDYSVQIVLLNDFNSSFRYSPKTFSGDAGEGKFAGTGRKIVWHYKQDLPEGLKGEGYYFEATATEAGGGISWYYYVIGATAVGGGVGALLGSGKKSTTTTQNTTSDLPAPPARP